MCTEISEKNFNEEITNKKIKIEDTSVEEMITDDNSKNVLVTNCDGIRTLMRVRNEHIIIENDVITGTILDSEDTKVKMEIKNLNVWRHTEREEARIKKSSY